MVCIYAIYPFDRSKNFAGVYVGSTDNLKRRIKLHLNNKRDTSQALLHSLMRENGYVFQVLEEIDCWEDAHLEYDWIDFFETNSNLTVFNKKVGCFSADWKRCKKPWGVPVFTGGGVAWR